jgi:hypothetical protein
LTHNIQSNKKRQQKVYVHYSVKPAAGGPVLYSTRKEEGGAGQPLALLLGRGQRGPRSWELAVMSECILRLLSG